MKKLLCILCTAFVALLSLSSCSKPKDSGSGDSDIVGTWKLNKVTDLQGNRQDIGPVAMTLTFTADGILKMQDYTGSFDVRWTRNGDFIFVEGEFVGDGLQGLKILKLTAQELELQFVYRDGFDLIHYLTRVN